MVDKRSILYKRTPTGARVEIVRDRPGAAMVGVQALTKHPLLGRVSCVQEHPPATRLGSSEIGDGRALRLVGRRERGGRTATLCVEVYRNSLAESSDLGGEISLSFPGRVHPPASPHLGDVVFLMFFFPSRTGEKREAVASTPSWGRRLCPQTLPVNSPRAWSVDQGRDEGLFVSPSHHPLHDYRFERKRCEKKTNQLRVACPSVGRGSEHSCFAPLNCSDSYLVDPASSHTLVSKIKPCMSKYNSLYGKTANGSLYQL